VTRGPGLVGLLVVVTLLLSFDLGGRTLATNDETRFPMLARDILSGGNWALPGVDGRPHLNKPPLSAWAIALPAWASGAVTPSNAVWPFVVAALGVVFATSWIGSELWDTTTGVTAGFIVATTHGVFSLARAPMPDMLLCLFITLAVAVFVAARFGDGRVPIAAFYVCVALGFWAKGPVALLAFVVVAVYTVRVGGWSGFRGLGVLPGVLLFALLITPWLVLCLGGGRAPDFMQDIVMADWLSWYVPGTFRWRGLTEPITQTLAILLPWSPLVPFALVPVSAPELNARRSQTLLLVWAGVVFVFVGVGAQQRMRYYLPLCPPAALLIAAWAQRRVRPRTMVAIATAGAVAAGMVGWQIWDDRRQNAGTDLRELQAITRASDAPIYAIDVPELVLSFYVERPVAVVSKSDLLDRGAGHGIVAIADRMPAQWSDPPRLATLGHGRVNGRRFSVMRLER
jgi:4-amino-4-deoxy-L-arabinose transferase-like glycosyltransferase